MKAKNMFFVLGCLGLVLLFFLVFSFIKVSGEEKFVFSNILPPGNHKPILLDKFVPGYHSGNVKKQNDLAETLPPFFYVKNGVKVQIFAVKGGEILTTTISPPFGIFRFFANSGIARVDWQNGVVEVFYKKNLGSWLSCVIIASVFIFFMVVIWHEW